MRRRTITSLLFAIGVAIANFLGAVFLGVDATVCADIGSSCALPNDEKTLIEFFAFPMSHMPDGIHQFVLSVFGTDIFAVFVVLFINAVIWGTVALACALALTIYSSRRLRRG